MEQNVSGVNESVAKPMATYLNYLYYKNLCVKIGAKEISFQAYREWWVDINIIGQGGQQKAPRLPSDSML